MVAERVQRPFADDEAVEVRMLPHNQFGLFARRNFRQGETILGLPAITQPEPDKYSIEAWPGIHLDCSEHPAGYLNHSCTPNAAVRGGAVTAWSCIKAGEQVTIDYQATENNLASPFECGCGSCEGGLIRGKYWKDMATN